MKTLPEYLRNLPTPDYGRVGGTSNYPYLAAGSSPTHVIPPRQSLLEIVRDGQMAAPAADPVLGMIADREHAAWLAIDDLVQQARQRLHLYHQHIEELKHAHFAAIDAMTDWQTPRELLNREQRLKLHELLHQVYQAQRDERLDLWRDLSRLRLAMPEAVGQYLGALRRRQLLDVGGEGA